MTLSCFHGRWQKQLRPGMAPKQSSKPTVIFHQVEQSSARTTLPVALKLPQNEDTRHPPPLSFLPPLPPFPSWLMSLHAAPLHTPHATLLPWAHPHSWWRPSIRVLRSCLSVPHPLPETRCQKSKFMRSSVKDKWAFSLAWKTLGCIS